MGRVCSANAQGTAVLADPSNPAHESQVQELRSIAVKRALKIVPVHARESEALDQAMVRARHSAEAVTDFAIIFRRSAEYVDKILKGTRPADMPIEQATNYIVAVNPQDSEVSRLSNPAIHTCAGERGRPMTPKQRITRTRITLDVGRAAAKTNLDH